MSTMADYDRIAPMLEVRVDMNQERNTTIAMRYTSSSWPKDSDDEGNPAVHTYLSTSLDADQVRQLIAALRQGIGGD